MDAMHKVRIKKLRLPVDDYRYTVDVLTSIDGGKTYWYAGNGRYCKTKKEAEDYKAQLKQDYTP